MTLFEGAQLKDYVIERRLGAGAFGAVWGAIHQQTGERVAIKALLRTSGGPVVDHVARFRREAVNLRRVQSEYVARLIDFIVDDTHGMLLIMEWIDGELLSDVLQETNLSLVEAIELGIHLARGLTDMHAVGVIHRDIKPSNIMIRSLPNGMQRAVIFDLGLSRFNPTEPIAPDDNSSADVTATASRVAIGTPAYMAPEQILDARRSTEASDIYGVGVVLYLAVSGRHPFVGDERAIANQKLMSEALPADIGRLDQLGMGFTEVISKCIRRRPDERYASGPELLRDLDALRTLALSQPQGSAISVAPELYGSALSPDMVPRLRQATIPDNYETDRRTQRAYIVAVVAGSLAVLIVVLTYFLRA